MLPIKPGIKGIKKILADNNAGWHVIDCSTDQYFTFYALRLSDVRTLLKASPLFTHHQIIDFTGNGILIAKIS